MSYNAKNYTEQGAEKTVIGGTLEILDSAEVIGLTDLATSASASTLGGIKAATKGAGDTVEVKIDTTSNKLYVPAYPTTATAATAGLVKQAATVAAAAGDTPTKAEFNALITALIAAGIIAA